MNSSRIRNLGWYVGYAWKLGPVVRCVSLPACRPGRQEGGWYHLQQVWLSLLWDEAYINVTYFWCRKKPKCDKCVTFAGIKIKFKDWPNIWTNVFSEKYFCEQSLWGKDQKLYVYELTYGLSYYHGSSQKQLCSITMIPWI